MNTIEQKFKRLERLVNTLRKNSGNSNFKTYAINFTQFGTSQPLVNEIFNDLSTAAVITRENIGSYRLRSSAFASIGDTMGITTNNTTVSVLDGDAGGLPIAGPPQQDIRHIVARVSNGTIDFDVRDSSGNAVDWQRTNCIIEVKVYN